MIIFIAMKVPLPNLRCDQGYIEFMPADVTLHFQFVEDSNAGVWLWIEIVVLPSVDKGAVDAQDFGKYVENSWWLSKYLVTGQIMEVLFFKQYDLENDR